VILRLRSRRVKISVLKVADLLCAGVVQLFAEFNLAALYKIPLCVEVIVRRQMEHRVVHVSCAGGDIRATREREIQFARRDIKLLCHICGWLPAMQ
jgi:hypothetical protein